MKKLFLFLALIAGVPTTYAALSDDRSPIEIMDRAIGNHYKEHGRGNDYYKNGVGKFAKYCEESDCDTDDLEHDLNGGIEDSVLIWFDDEFFPHTATDMTEAEKEREIFTFLKRIYNEKIAVQEIDWNSQSQEEALLLSKQNEFKQKKEKISTSPHPAGTSAVDLQELYGSEFYQEVIITYEKIEKDISLRNRKGKYYCDPSKLHKPEPIKDSSNVECVLCQLGDCDIEYLRNRVDRRFRSLKGTGVERSERVKFRNALGSKLEKAITDDDIHVAMYLILHKATDIACKYTRKEKHKKYYLQMVCAKSPKSIFAADYIRLAKALIDRDKSLLNRPEEAREDGETALHCACQSGNLDLVNLLLSYEEIKVDIPTGRGVRPIGIACGYGHWRVVERLLAHNGVDPNLPPNLCYMNSVPPIGKAIAWSFSRLESYNTARKRYETDLSKATDYYKRGRFNAYKKAFSSLTASYEKLVTIHSNISRQEKTVNLLLQCKRHDLKKNYSLREALKVYVKGGVDFFPILLKEYPDMLNELHTFASYGCKETLLHALCDGKLYLGGDGKLDGVKKLLSLPSIDTRVLNENNTTVLVQAIQCRFLAADRTFRHVEIVEALVEHKSSNAYFLLNAGAKPPVLGAYLKCCEIIEEMKNDSNNRDYYLREKLFQLKEIIAYLLAHRCTDINLLYGGIRDCKEVFNLNDPFLQEVGDMLKNGISCHLCTGYLRQLCSTSIKLDWIVDLIAPYAKLGFSANLQI